VRRGFASVVEAMNKEAFDALICSVARRLSR
jgi:hypothetical protein